MATVGHGYLKILPSLQGLGQHVRDQVRAAQAGAPAISLTAQVQTALLREQLRVAAREGDQTAIRLLAELDALPAETRFQALLRRLSGREITVRAVADRSLGSAVRGMLALGRASDQATGSMVRATAVTGAATLRYAAMAAAVGTAMGVVGGLGGAAATSAQSLLLIPAAALGAVAVIQTLKLGVEGFTDALSESDPAKFAEAINKMPPAMRATAEAVRGLRPEFTALQLHVQERLFGGLAREVTTLGGRYLPVLDAGMTGVAGALNQGARGVAAFLGQARTVADVRSIFADTALTVGRLGQGLPFLLAGLRDIATVGAQFLPALAGGFTEGAQRFAEFIGHARETGQLKTWISQGLSALGELFTLVGNVGGIIAAVFRAANTSGASFLTTLTQVTGSVLAFLRSADGQTALAQVFGGIAAVAKGLDPILVALGHTLVDSIAPVIAALGPQLGTALASIAPAIGPLGQVFAALAPVLGAAAQAFADMLVPAAQALAPIVAALAPALAEVATLMGGAVGESIRSITPALLELARVLAPLITQFGGLLAESLRTLAPMLAALLRQLTPIISAVGGAFLQALAAVLPLLGQVAMVFGEVLLAGLRAVQPVLPVIVGLIEQVAAMVSGALADAAPTLVQIGQTLGEVMVTAVSALAPILPPLAKAFLTVVQAVLPLVPPLLELVQALIPPLTGLVTALVPVIVQAADTFATLVRAVAPLIDILARVLMPILDTLLGVVRSVFDTIGSIIGGAMRYIQGIIDTVMGLITGDWSRAWNGLKNAFGGIWDMIRGAVGGALDGLVRFFIDLPGRILGALGDLGGLLVEAGKNIIRGLIRGLEAAWQWIKDKLKSLTNLLPDWKGPPARDRVLLVDNGRLIMRGLLTGLQAGTPAVRSYLDSLTTTLPLNMDATLTATGRTAAPGGASPMGADTSAITAAVAAGVLAALDGARLHVDGAGVARLVNTANAQNARR
ncbi:Phage tail length tape-measure protein [Alloactinosynnema sp. L-07]|uniref:phage tail protein n=1 Tax=Alloactinosynnema sp. L-07 TaxID=1653480 RepID=UPI00065EF40C|nr:hypothetical protein [Alloactinosynnema sp. L-07]CRK55424.1 Phage tail length tape-measure protein [Alloactinosynnema sp. L-07]